MGWEVCCLFSFMCYDTTIFKLSKEKNSDEIELHLEFVWSLIAGNF